MRLAVGFACALLACGGGAQESTIGAPASPAMQSAEWPPHAPSPPDAATVQTVLGTADGTQVRVRAHLVAVTLPCPACNTNLGERHTVARQDAIGRARPPAPTPGPGCAPCPTPAATFSDDPAGGTPLRAVGGAEGLQARHVGHVFLLTGTFHANGPMGPELDVTDVRALDSPRP